MKRVVFLLSAIVTCAGLSLVTIRAQQPPPPQPQEGRLRPLPIQPIRLPTQAALSTTSLA